MLPKEIPITPSLSSVLNRIVENGRINSDTETIETGIQFLEEAQRDSKTCQLLYKKKVFSHSVYHLQQAVEKAVKSYVLITGFYKANEMKKIAIHQSPLIVIKALTEKTGMKRDAQSRHDQTTLTLILNAERAIGNDENQAALTKMSQTEIRGLLSQIKGFYSITEKIMKDLKRIGVSLSLDDFGRRHYHFR